MVRRFVSIVSTGFTLMELIAVTCLISLFLMFSIPRLQALTPMDPLNATVRRIISTVTELKNVSLRDGREYILHLDADHRLMWISHELMTDAETEAARKNGFYLPADVRIEHVEIAGTVGKPSRTADIIFNRRGYSSKAMIHLRGAGAGTVSLLIETFLPDVRYFARRMTFQDG
jgi:Tfp pilus assembly protein FimT